MIYRHLGRTGLKVLYCLSSLLGSADCDAHVYVIFSDEDFMSLVLGKDVRKIASCPQVSVLSYGAWVTFGNQIGVPGMI